MITIDIENKEEEKIHHKDTVTFPNVYFLVSCLLIHLIINYEINVYTCENVNFKEMYSLIFITIISYFTYTTYKAFKMKKNIRVEKLFPTIPMSELMVLLTYLINYDDYRILNQCCYNNITYQPFLNITCDKIQNRFSYFNFISTLSWTVFRIALQFLLLKAQQ